MAVLPAEARKLVFIGVPSHKDQLPLGLFPNERVTMATLGEHVAAQHLKDRVSPYLEDEQLRLAREEAWRNLVTLRLGQAGNLISLMRGLELAKHAEAELAKKEATISPLFDPFKYGVFAEIQDLGSRAILTDMLRAAIHHTGYQNWIEEQSGFYRDIGRAFYGDAFRIVESKDGRARRGSILETPFNRSLFPDVCQIKPGKVMQLALEGNIDAPRNYTYT